MIKVEYDSGDIDERLRQLSDALGLSVRDIARDAMRTGCASAVVETFPHKKSDGSNAIERDLHRIFWPIGKNKIAPGRSIIKNWNPKNAGGDVARAFKLANGAVVYADRSSYKPSGSTSELRRFHESHRGSRGRVRGKLRKFKVGTMTFSPKIFMKPGAFNSYKRERQKGVGKLKSGWLPALRYFERVTFSKGSSRVPPWVKRHEAGADGSWIDTIGEDGSGSMSARNNAAGWIDSRRQGLESHVQKLMSTYLMDHMDKRKDSIVKRFNEGRSLAGARAI